MPSPKGKPSGRPSQIAGGTSPRRPGLERVALDLHVHTPASKDWRDSTPTAEEFVHHAISRGLQGVAITDHTTGAWVDQLSAAAKGTGLTIFPGVELNNLAGNEGVHLVAIFDTEFTSVDIDRFLTTVGALSGSGTRTRRGSATSGPVQVLDAVHEFGGIAVLAHCGTSKGALAGMRGDLRTQIVRHPALLAAEASPDDFYDEAKKARHKRLWDILDGTDPVFRRELAVYSASDDPSGTGHGHGLAGIGNRFSYFWMEQPLTLEGLRQCLIDRGARIELPTPGAPVTSAPARQAPSIARMQVTGGFFDKLDVGFHEGLTTILGAKGSGKSLLIELLRFALGQQPTQPEILRDHETKLEKRLGLYGRVSLEIRQADTTLVRVEREYDPAKGNPWRSAVTPADVISCHFLSQGEIVRIAESADEQIRFIDSFFDFGKHQRSINDARGQLAALDREEAKQIAAVGRRNELAIERARLKAEVRQKDLGLKSLSFSKYQRAQAKSRVVEGAVETVAQVIDVLEEAEQAVDAAPLPTVPPNLRRDPTIKRVGLLAKAARDEAAKAIAGAATRARSSIDRVEAEQKLWAVDLEKAENAHSRQVQKAGGDQRALSQARTRLEGELSRVERELGSTGRLATLLEPTVRRRNDLLTALRERQDEYTQERQERCQWFEEKSNGQIKAAVSAGSDRSQFRQRLTAMKKGSYLTGPEIDAIASTVTPDALVEALLAFNGNHSQGALAPIAAATGLGLPRIVVLAEFLLDQARGDGFERLLELQYTVTPADRPEISFRREDGSFAPLSELSTGQKCTALLVMALAEGDYPIVVDQPEDSLDIRSIWEDMCVRLRIAKRERQFAFTTHNSSLAVASDSDTFLVLAGDARRGEVVLAGAIDHQDMRDEVIKLLEGGPPTYFLKQRKYHISDPFSA